MKTIKARFDGSVLIPEEPLELPVDTIVEFEVPSCDEKLDVKPAAGLAALMAQYPEDPDWPKDGSAQVDHYLYGLPKQ
jgi:hypothetical protein